jgi:3-oxoacyl-[acyl-carrier-protein] synthase II
LNAAVIDFSINGALSRMGDFALFAAEEALVHAGFLPGKFDGFRFGCAVSQSKPVLNSHTSFLDPQLLLSTFTGLSAESVIKTKFQLHGPSANVVAACATGIASIQTGTRWIEENICDVVLVGASESSLNSFYQSGFQKMGVLIEGSDVSNVCPFDRKRKGFVMGEGAAVMVLESEETCLSRGGTVLATLQSVRMEHSAHDAIRFDTNGAAIARLIKNVLKNKKSPDYINAHGTGTEFNDWVETSALRTVFGPRANSIPVSSTKAATGHLLGAAGAVEAAFAVLALRDQVVPPTLHLKDADPNCDLDYVPVESRKKILNSTLSLSYGFGGQIGGVLFGK